MALRPLCKIAGTIAQRSCCHKSIVHRLVVIGNQTVVRHFLTSANPGGQFLRFIRRSMQRSKSLGANSLIGCIATPTHTYTSHELSPLHLWRLAHFEKEPFSRRLCIRMYVFCLSCTVRRCAVEILLA